MEHPLVLDEMVFLAVESRNTIGAARVIGGRPDVRFRSFSDELPVIGSMPRWFGIEAE
jgi:hypothetical protein